MATPKLIAAVIGILLMVGVAHAAPIVGLGDPITNPALSGGTVIDFDTGPTGDFTTQTFGDVTFTGVGAPFTIGPDFINQFNTRGVNSLFNGFDLLPDAFRFDFANPVNALAFNWGAADNHWLLSAFDADGNLLESFVVPQTFSSNAGEFFGIAHDGIKFATLTDQNDVFQGDFVFIDNFTFFTAPIVSPVPAPATLLLLVGALAGLGVLRRLRA
jgi:hypothetical protein